jgi:hypothetical protein
LNAFQLDLRNQRTHSHAVIERITDPHRAHCFHNGLGDALLLVRRNVDARRGGAILSRIEGRRERSFFSDDRGIRVVENKERSLAPKFEMYALQACGGCGHDFLPGRG